MDSRSVVMSAHHAGIHSTTHSGSWLRLVSWRSSSRTLTHVPQLTSGNDGCRRSSRFPKPRADPVTDSPSGSARALR
jgi:hypothetical protein